MKISVRKIVFIAFIVICAFLFYKIQMQTIETFTPVIRETYRPYIRKARKICEEVYTENNHSITNFLRKVGIM